MRLLLVNIILAMLWIFLWGDLTLYTLVVGLLLGYGVLYLFTRVVRRDMLRDAYGQRVTDLFSFGIYFTKLLFASNWETAKEILTPGMSVRPRIVRYEVTGMSDLQITTLSNAITLTPGTLVVDMRDEEPDDNPDETVTEELAEGIDPEDDARPPRPRELGRRYIYVHCLYAEDREAAVAEIDELRRTMQRKVFNRP